MPRVSHNRRKVRAQGDQNTLAACTEKRKAQAVDSEVREKLVVVTHKVTRVALNDHCVVYSTPDGLVEVWIKVWTLGGEPLTWARMRGPNLAYVETLVRAVPDILTKWAWRLGPSSECRRCVHITAVVGEDKWLKL